MVAPVALSLPQNESHRPAAACKLPESLAISGTYILEVVCKKKQNEAYTVCVGRAGSDRGDESDGEGVCRIRLCCAGRAVPFVVSKGRNLPLCSGQRYVPLS